MVGGRRGSWHDEGGEKGRGTGERRRWVLHDPPPHTHTSPLAGNRHTHLTPRCLPPPTHAPHTPLPPTHPPRCLLSPHPHLTPRCPPPPHTHTHLPPCCFLSTRCRGPAHTAPTCLMLPPHTHPAASNLPAAEACHVHLQHAYSWCSPHPPPPPPHTNRYFRSTGCCGPARSTPACMVVAFGGGLCCPKWIIMPSLGHRRSRPRLSPPRLMASGPSCL